MNVRVRFAPSPTGIPHVGNIRTALFNYFFAKANNGNFILRIEDTDRARFVEGSQDAIKESLSWLGVKWNEFIVQSENVSEYMKLAKLLVARGAAREEKGAIRFIVPEEGITSWQDAVGGKKIEFQNSEVEDFIILKSDGFPTYHLANVVDDYYEKITHVIRGEDWISSTPKHILLYKAFGWEPPTFAHVPNVFGTDGKKLSKRRGAKSVIDFKREGFLPDALLNFLMLLGWSPKGDREVLSVDEIAKEFSLERVHTAPAVFDPKKLLWMNGVYIRQKTDEELARLLGDFYREDASVLHILKADEAKRQIISLAKTRMNVLADFKALVVRHHIKERDLQTAIRFSLIKEFNRLELNKWTKDSIFEILKDVMKEYRVKMPILYEIFTGHAQGLPLPDFMEALGKDGTLDRLTNK